MEKEYQHYFMEFIQSLRMTKLSLEVWADTDSKRCEVEGRIGTLTSMIELGTALYEAAGQKEEQRVY